jgi:hypothetical protein
VSRKQKSVKKNTASQVHPKTSFFRGPRAFRQNGITFSVCENSRPDLNQEKEEFFSSVFEFREF